MPRFEAWERRLNAVIDKYRRLPFERSRRDCTMFVAECVWCLTQKNPGDPYRGKYDDASAAALVESFGGLEQLVEKTCAAAGIHIERIDRNFAQRGDVCLMGAQPEPALGICMGTEIVSMSKAGLGRRPLSEATIVWAIR